jgi:CRP-like cAMP-binding protein
MRQNLSTISSIQLDDLCRNVNLEVCGLGEDVFKQGDVGDKLFIILCGKCDIKVTYKVESTSGESELREKVIVSLSNGQHFGERALLFEEPRAATVTCVHHTELISISKSTYLAVMNQFDDTLKGQNKLHLSKDSKEYVVRVLTKARHRRTAEEIESISSYLGRKITFFEKLDYNQRLEVCRVAEILPVWGKSILYKQGSIGQAFYIILTGSVEIYVLNSDKERNKDQGRFREVSIFDGLGDKVSTLTPGESFGERALESKNRKID